MDKGVKCIKSDYTVDQYVRGTVRSLGKLPDGMTVGSCNYTNNSFSGSFTKGNVKIEDGEIMFSGNQGTQVTPHIRVTVYIGFVPI